MKFRCVFVKFLCKCVECFGECLFIELRLVVIFWFGIISFIIVVVWIDVILRVMICFVSWGIVFLMGGVVLVSYWIKFFGFLFCLLIRLLSCVWMKFFSICFLVFWYFIIGSICMMKLRLVMLLVRFLWFLEVIILINFFVYLGNNCRIFVEIMIVLV